VWTLNTYLRRSPWRDFVDVLPNSGKIVETLVQTIYHTYSGYVVVVNKKFWEALPADCYVRRSSGSDGVLHPENGSGERMRSAWRARR